MSIDLNALSSATLTAQALSGLILATPQSIGYQAQAPAVDRSVFVFDYEGENSITLESDITDHYVEDNTAIQDQISLKPETVQTTGYIGELNNVIPPALQAIKTAADKLVSIAAFEPELTATAMIAYNRAFQAFQTAQLVANSAVAAWNSLSGGPQTKQQIAYMRFYGYWKARQLFTVQTPWAVFKDMAILRLHPVQDEDTRVISSFEMTFKQIRFAKTITTNPTNKFAGRATAQAADVTDHGVGTLGARRDFVTAA